MLDQFRRREHAATRVLLRKHPYAETQAECERRKRQFTDRYGGNYPKAVTALVERERFLTAFRARGEAAVEELRQEIAGLEPEEREKGRPR